MTAISTTYQLSHQEPIIHTRAFRVITTYPVVPSFLHYHVNKKGVHQNY